LMACPMQGEMMRWDDVMERDMSWNTLIFGLSPSTLSFATKADINMLPTPDNLKRWRLGVYPCGVCGKTAVTLAHILTHCSVALVQKRYTFRHDLVLRVLYDCIRAAIASMSPESVRRATDAPIRFHLAGEKPPPAKKAQRTSIIQSAADWKLACDLRDLGEFHFPINAAATERRPDIVLWSDATRQLVLLELTVPDENNVVSARQRKLQRYVELIAECKERYPGTVCLTVEVGVRGHIAHQSQSDLLRLGVWSAALRSELSKAALRGSYAIYVNRNNREWCWDAALPPV
jgi:hypothetical protein